MKYLPKLFSISILLLIAGAVPLSEHAANAGTLRQASWIRNTPQQWASGLPTPWPKKPGGVRDMPQHWASGLPTPWPKKPGGVRDMPQQWASGLPTPWPKKPGGFGDRPLPWASGLPTLSSQMSALAQAS